MSAAAQLHRDERQEIIELYRGLLADAMLGRIVTFTQTSAFVYLARELAERLGCDEQYAAMQLFETSSAIYAGAKAAWRE
jgi:hypothetical protein